MKDLELRHLRAIIRSRILFPHILEALEGKVIPSRSRNRLTDAEVLDIQDECFDVWQNESPMVYQRHQRGDYGEYPIQVSGVPGAYFVAAMEFDEEGPFETRQAPSLRAIYDLGDGGGEWMFGPGQVGNPFSEHYGDLLDDWRKVRYRKLDWTPPKGPETLLLKPALR